MATSPVLDLDDPATEPEGRYEVIDGRIVVDRDTDEPEPALRSSEESPRAAATPLDLDDPAIEPDFLYEVIDGEFVEIPYMGAPESVFASKLVHILNLFDPDERFGQVVLETLFVINARRRRRPDVAFVSSERWPLGRGIPRRNAWDVVPDLAVEVVSTHDKAVKLAEKIEEYFRAGARLVWAFYPSLSLLYVYDSPNAVRLLRAGDELDGGAVLPGFRVSLATLFGAQAEPEPTAEPGPQRAKA